MYKCDGLLCIHPGSSNLGENIHLTIAFIRSHRFCPVDTFRLNQVPALQKHGL